MGREETVTGTSPVHRGNGDGTLKRYLGQRGRAGLDGGSVSKRQVNWRQSRESERVIVPLNPGKAGGGKTPVEEVDDRGRRRLAGGKRSKCGTPPGGIISPLLICT
jgi:hypothetical protein